VRTPPQILVADDNPANVDIFRTRLSAHGYDIISAGDGEEALRRARESRPDLIVLDIMMPKMNGIEVCRAIKADRSLPYIPIILVTARTDPKDVVAGLEAGAEEYLTKPIDQTALIARIKSVLRIKGLQDQTLEQAKRLEVQAAELAQMNKTLEKRVADQLEELQRANQLRRFFSPQLADLIVSSKQDELMAGHRREITVVFCDLRGFTAFSEVAEPEEVMGVLREYHSLAGPLIFEYGATLEHFAGDGLMAILNDPVPVDDPAARAVRMAVAIRNRVMVQVDVWAKRGYDLGLGIGIATGYATLGQIGFEGRFHYGAIGTVLNVASRLCNAAESGQILIARRVAMDAEGIAEMTCLGEMTLKGLRRPVVTYAVGDLNSAETA
jgi:adenylate cyclase